MISLVGTGFVNRTVAQSSYYLEEPRTFYAGPILGANFTQVDGDNFAGYHKVGINVGGIVYAQLAEHFAASMEILFSQKGARSNTGKPASKPNYIIEDYHLNFNYAEVPIQLNFFDKRKSHFGGGLSVSQMVSYSETLKTTPFDPDAQDLETKYPVKKIDLNFVLGGNLHLWKGLFLNMRFQYSLLPIRTNIPAGYGRTQQFNNMYTLRLVYLFI